MLINGTTYNDARGETEGDDELRGLAGADTLDGGGGNDLLNGAGADTLDGGAGIDTATYVDSLAAVTVTLGGTNSGGDAQGNRLTNIENLIGSRFDDRLTGDGLANLLQGGAGHAAGGKPSPLLRRDLTADAKPGGSWDESTLNLMNSSNNAGRNIYSTCLSA